ncbi:MAG: MFS transporter [Gammaproteobacteria bacterium]
MSGARRARIAWAFYDWANNGYMTVIQTFVFATYFTRQVAADAATGTTQWGHTIAAAGLLVALVGPLAGAIADQGGRRKPWLAAFTLFSVLATAGLWSVRPDGADVPRALTLVLLATIGAELAAIFYNAMLTAIAPAAQVGRWSGLGWGLGYLGGLLCLLLALFAFVGDDAWFALDRATAGHVRAACLLAAAWYGFFALPLFLFTPDSSGARVPLARAAGRGARQLAATLRNARRYAGIGRFLLARMFYIDGLATVFAFGGVYAAGTFAMDEGDVLRFGIALSATAGAGAWLFAGIDDRIGAKRTIVITLSGLLATAVLAVTAQAAWQFWAAGMALGVFVGPVQAASRSYLARVAPPSLVNEMFGLYALAGKATAFLGPFLVASVTAATGSQRAGMSVVLAFLVTGLVLLAGVPSDRGEAPRAR